jgi:hypothetical protein
MTEQVDLEYPAEIRQKTCGFPFVPVHQELCFGIASGKLVMPTERNNIVKFKDYLKMIQRPYCIFLDCESIPVDIDEAEQKHKGCVQEHKICGFAIALIRSSDNAVVKFNSPFGKNMEKELVECLCDAGQYVHKHEIMNAEAWKMFKSAKQCNICHANFTKQN